MLRQTSRGKTVAAADLPRSTSRAPGYTEEGNMTLRDGIFLAGGFLAGTAFALGLLAVACLVINKSL
jgi:hypothetical protein